MDNVDGVIEHAETTWIAGMGFLDLSYYWLVRIKG